MVQTATKLPEMLLWLDANRGQYIPQVFANTFADRSAVQGITEEDWVVLQEGPDPRDKDETFVWPNERVEDAAKGETL